MSSIHETKWDSINSIAADLCYEGMTYNSFRCILNILVLMLLPGHDVKSSIKGRQFV